MVEVSQAVLDYARRRYESSVENLLDDPSDLLHEWRNEEPADYFRDWRQLGRDMGLDFDALVEQHGTPYERKRLRDIESGKLRPMPRRPIPKEFASG